MKSLQLPKWLVALLCMGLVLGIVGCSNDDDAGPPESIHGTWATTFTQPGSEAMNETWTFTQTGQNVSGSYTFGLNTWSFTGTYVNGAFAGVDGDNWVLNITFSGNTGTGTIAGDGDLWNAVLTR